MRKYAVVVFAIIALLTLFGQALAAPPDDVALSLTSSRPDTIFGEDLTFTATTDPPVTATLTIGSGRATLGTIDVVDGTGTWTSDTLPAGPHSIWISCKSGCSGAPAAMPQTIGRANARLAAAIDAVSDAGTNPRITVAVSLEHGGEYMPEGNIDIVENHVVLASARLRNGAVSFDLDDLASGEHAFTVRYYGNENCFDSETTLRHTVPEARVRVEPVSVAEGNASSNLVTVNVRLSGKSSHGVDVSWATADGGAVAGVDYDAASGTLSFAPGETQKQISVNVIGNTTPEPDKTFTIEVTGPQNTASAAVRIVNDDPFFRKLTGIAYGPAADQTLDLYVPVTGSGPYPAIVGIEATAFLAADPNANVTTREAERGYIVAKLSFRSAEKALFPAQVQDVKAAVRWLRANATEYQLDPNRVGVWGIGAGGHLAALLATSDADAPFELGVAANAQFSGRVQAAVEWFGEIDVAVLEDPMYARYLGCAAADCPDLAAQANATNYVTMDDPPLLMVHGANDRSVPVTTAQDLYAALRNVGVDARLTVVDGAGHGGPEWNDPALLEQVDRFFDEKLKP